MLALILLEANLDPSFLIGGDVNEIGTSAAWGRGEWLVVEADESDGTFLRLGAELALVTNVDPDHLDHYGTVDALGIAFSRFLSRCPLRSGLRRSRTGALARSRVGAHLRVLARRRVLHRLIYPAGAADILLRAPSIGVPISAPLSCRCQEFTTR